MSSIVISKSLPAYISGIELAYMISMDDIFDKEILNKIRDHMLSYNETIAVAESVTARYLQAAFSLADNALHFFQGGITAYNLGQKCRHLHINPIHAQSCNCVSEKVAGEMAINVTKSFISDWGIAITGYASKLPEMSINSLFAYYAICYKNEIVEAKKIYADDDADAMHAQLYYANETLSRLYTAIEKRVTCSS